MIFLLYTVILTLAQNHQVFARPAIKWLTAIEAPANPTLVDATRYTTDVYATDIILPPNSTTILALVDSIGVTQIPQKSATIKETGDLSGSIPVSLEIEGRPSIQPFPTFVPSAVKTIAVDPAATISPSASLVLALPTSTGTTVKKTLNLRSSATPKVDDSGQELTFNHLKWRDNHREVQAHEQNQLKMEKRGATDCFRPLPTATVPGNIYSRGDHPVPRRGIAAQEHPVSTNKFYANLFLGNQNQGVWTHPYSLTWSKGGGVLKSWGLAVSHIDANQRAYGPQNSAIPGAPVKYFINPVGIQSIILSASELGSQTALSTHDLHAMSINLRLSPQAGSSSGITFPLVQGMGFVTAQYQGLQPTISSAVYFRTFTPMGQVKSGLFKYHVMLEDGKNWLIYIIPANGRDPQLRLVSTTQIQGVAGWQGTIQVARNPGGSGSESIYDSSAGVFPTYGSVSASVSGATGTYNINWTKGGFMRGHPLLMFALPHQTESFDMATASKKTNLMLQTTTKGVATAVLSDSWTLVESDLPTDMSFAPWSPTLRSRTTLSYSAISSIRQVARSELSQDINAQSNLDSMYFSGKALSKFAVLIYTTRDLLHDSATAADGLARLKTAFARFVNNQQIHPLAYDTVWKGVVSSGGYGAGNDGQDFGNTFYNDHHFHYGYFIHAASIIAYLDPTWLTSTNVAWVNNLVRDAANPSNNDAYSPFSRMFDWYHGHSFAKGLYESADSKDEESSSEDTMFAYAIKMWGKVTGDQSMEARGNLMLAILKRSLNDYFLMQKSNTIQPSNFIANKATGILFENKIDHATYFGMNPEYIEGIHMLPLLPFSTFTRQPNFIAEEWAAYFSPTSFTPASKVVGGWRGILYGNLACIDPRSAWSFFSQNNFDGSWIDGGVSRTWYLAFSGALGGF